MEKYCNKCSNIKDVTEFTKDNNKKDGLRTICRNCTNNAYHNIYKIRPENIERLKNYRNNPIVKERQKLLNQTEKYKEKQRLRDQREDVKKRKALHLKNRKSRDQINKRRLERYYTEPLYRLKCIIRSTTLNSFKKIGLEKQHKTSLMLGCSYEEFKIYIESKFTEGMNWNLYGKIHIDHIKPLSSAKTKEEMIKLAHYTNLQPLWAEDNLKKSDNYYE